MLDNGEKPIYVAEKDGVVVAHLFCQCKILGTTKQKIFYLDDLCVDEKCRRQGIGTALFAFFKEEAKRRGCYAISLSCWTGNEEAASFYKKMGMGVRSETLELILK
jgi:ribosomal protein S18 acetylase RimI-like enzyme